MLSFQCDLVYIWNKKVFDRETQKLYTSFEFLGKTSHTFENILLVPSVLKRYGNDSKTKISPALDIQVTPRTKLSRTDDINNLKENLKKMLKWDYEIDTFQSKLPGSTIDLAAKKEEKIKKWNEILAKGKEFSAFLKAGQFAVGPSGKQEIISGNLIDLPWWIHSGYIDGLDGYSSASLEIRVIPFLKTTADGKDVETLEWYEQVLQK